MRRLLSVLVSLATVFSSAGVVLARPAVAAAPGAGVVQGTVWARTIGIYSYDSVWDVLLTGTLDVGASASYVGQFRITGTSDPGSLPHGGCGGTLECQGIKYQNLPSAAPVTGDFTLAGSNDGGDNVAGTCGHAGPARIGPTAPTFICTVALNGAPAQQIAVTVSVQRLAYGNDVVGTYTTASTYAKPPGSCTYQGATASGKTLEQASPPRPLGPSLDRAALFTAQLHATSNCVFIIKGTVTVDPGWPSPPQSADCYPVAGTAGCQAVMTSADWIYPASSMSFWGTITAVDDGVQQKVSCFAPGNWTTGWSCDLADPSQPVTL